MPRENTVPRARSTRLSVALLLCLAGTATAATAVLAGPASAAPQASAGPRTPSDAAAQLTTGMMPASSPDAVAASAAATGSAARTAVAARATTAATQGVDVADYQHPNGAAITWSQVKASGQSFAIVKATEGTTYTNTYVTGDAAGARTAGLQVGLYHFARPALVNGSPVGDAQAEADHFSAQVKAVGGAQLPPTLDLEVNGGLSKSQLAAWTAAFLQRVQGDTGRRPMIYTGPYFWTDDVGSTSFTSYPLWEAHYTTAAAPMSFGGWSTWTLWQYSDGSFGSPAAIPGMTGSSVDRDRFAGSAAQLASFASASTGNVAPFTGTASPAAYPDGTIVSLAGSTAIYEIAGLAPLYVPSWADVGGPKRPRVLSAAQFYSLRSSPRDGTWLRSHETGQVYRVAGGAPLYITSFAPFGGGQPAVSVGQADFDNAGRGGVWNHLLAKPADGTFISGADSHAVYRIAGGAPVYVSSWSYFGGGQPTVAVNELTVDDAGRSSAFGHLSYRPANGTFIADPSAGSFWSVSNGRLAAVTNTGQAFTVEGDTAIRLRGQAGVWAHLL